MHNKAFIVDNAIAIVGGRNIGDNYFGVDTAANFRDLDLAVVGPVVQEVSGSFDRYWNSEFAVPVSAVVSERLSEQEFQEMKTLFYRWIEGVQDFPYPVHGELPVTRRLRSAVLVECTFSERNPGFQHG
jgi:putative cardiolipin synthase